MDQSERLVDLDHLNRYTGGDRALNEEILQLFDAQCLEMTAKLELLAQSEGPGSKAWRELTHTLKGAARGVGAFPVADVAATAEKLSPDPVAVLETIERLKARSAATHLYIQAVIAAAAD